MRRPKRITDGRKLKGGTWYIVVQVWTDMTMALEFIMPTGVVRRWTFKDGEKYYLFVRIRRISHRDKKVYSGKAYLGDYGMELNRRKTLYGVFEYNANNFNVLSKMVEGQRLEEYKRLIGQN
jgi:hypothetical protein